MSFAKFLIAKWRSRPERWDGPDIPIKAIEGTYYSTLTGGDPPTIEVDWEELEADIAKLEKEFLDGKAMGAPADSDRS